jgi:hypothetical protein
MIRHVFMWSVADSAEADAVFEELASLAQVVPRLRNWSIGKQVKSDVHSSVGDWQYILMSDFDTQEELDAYQAHPAHVDILERVFSRYKDWAVVDYEI